MKASACSDTFRGLWNLSRLHEIDALSLATDRDLPLKRVEMATRSPKAHIIIVHFTIIEQKESVEDQAERTN